MQTGTISKKETPCNPPCMLWTPCEPHINVELAKARPWGATAVLSFDPASYLWEVAKNYQQIPPVKTSKDQLR
jgi:hypothetical protein